MRVKALITALIAAAMSVAAQEPQPLRPVTAAYTLECGSLSEADSYLSPLTYRGWQSALVYERMQAMRCNPERMVMQLEARLDLGRGENPARNAEMWRINARLSWGMMRRWQQVITPGLTLAAGGSATIEGGALYNARNSNNPASAKASATLNLTGYAAYNTHIGRLPLTLRYQPTLPLIGAFFSPDYDELYYEIYLGNHHGLIHPAWPGNRFVMDHYLTADLHLGGTSLRVGYRYYFLSSEAGKLVTNLRVSSVVIGLSGEWLSLSRRHELSRDARIISALY